MWDWLENELDEDDWVNVVFEDFPNNTHGLAALDAATDLAEFLALSFEPTTSIKGIKRWLFNDTMGNLDFLRVEMETRFQSTTLKVESDDKLELDCIWIPAITDTEDSPTILFCNPNSGYYESLYYQSDWIDYYTS